MMKDNNEKLIEAKTLKNGVKVSLFDFCKPIAADRWYVKILCRIEVAVPEEKLAGSGLEVKEQKVFCKLCNNTLVHEFIKERNFIDEKEKDEVVAAIISQIQENSLGYMANQVFADNLFQQKVDEFMREQDVLRQMAMVKADFEDDDDGPADFSACFKD
jgi:hypothetical protein